MSAPVELEALLEPLRARGVRIGAEEYCRLQYALARQPQLDERTQRALLECTLVKTAEDREAFDAEYERWVRAAQWFVDARDPGSRPLEPGPPGPVGPAPPPSWRKLAAWSALAIAVVAAVVAALMWPPDAGGGPPIQRPVTQDLRDGGRSSGVEQVPTPPRDETGVVTEVEVWEPSVSTTPRIPQPLWLVALATVLAASARALRRVVLRRNPPIEAGAASPGQARLPRASARLEPVAVEFVPRDDARGMVWNVESFVSDEPTLRVDLARTVDATARSGGFASVRYQTAVYPREVLLVRDTMCADTRIPRLIEELSNNLRAAGLPTRSGHFYASPHAITWDESGEVTTAGALQSARDQAIVAVLTDGYGMDLQRNDVRSAETLDDALAQFATFPRLAFADFGDGEHALRAQLDPQAIRCIAPNDVARFIGGLDKPRGSDGLPQMGEVELEGALRAWAAGLALSGQPFDDARMFAVRQALGIPFSVWWAPAITARAAPHGRHWVFEEPLRRELCQWLIDAHRCTDADGRADVPPQSWLGRALRCWTEAYERELKALEARAPSERREGDSDAVRLEIAVLKLWTNPSGASDELVQLHVRFAEQVRRRVAHLRPRSTLGARGFDAADQIHLPWEWRAEHPDPLTKQRLYQIGFADGLLRPGVPRLPRSVEVAVGACWAAAAGLMVWAGALWLRSPRVIAADPRLESTLGATHELVRDENGPKLEYTTRDFVGEGEVKHAAIEQAFGWQAGLTGAPSYHAAQLFPDDVHLSWRASVRPNPELDAERELATYRRGRMAGRATTEDRDRPLRSVAIVVGPPSDLRAANLARRLLDGGWVDAVFVIAWPLNDGLMGDLKLGRGDQLLRFSDGKYVVPMLANYAWIDIRGDGLGVVARTPATPTAVDITALWGDRVRDTGVNAVPRVRLADSGVVMELADLPGGTFTMGSPTTEIGRDGDEAQHEVTLSPFSIGKYEVTRGQYRALMPTTPAEWYEGDLDERFRAILRRHYRDATITRNTDPELYPAFFEDIDLAALAAELEREFELKIGDDVRRRWTAVDEVVAYVREQRDRVPANYVSWFDAVRFCNALSLDHGRKPAYRLSGEDPSSGLEEAQAELVAGADGYRLATEAQWEYACRSRSGDAFWFGDKRGDLGTHDWHGANSRAPRPVGQLVANRFELFDMHGNVLEWCEDWYASYEGDGVDRGGPASGSFRVMRGGSFGLDAVWCRSADRDGGHPGLRDVDVGFRVVLPRGPERR